MKKQNDFVVQIGIPLLLTLIAILCAYLIVDAKTKNIANDVIAKYLALEYDKVGGKENYNAINAIQRDQIVEGLKQYEAQGWSIPENNSYNNNPDSSGKSMISLEQARKVTTEGTYILGNPDAQISFVEYSDLDCPFCQRLHESGTIGQILENYEGKVNFIFKHFPLPSHSNAQRKAEALECIGEFAGGEAYNRAVEFLFSNGADISPLPGEFGVSEDDFQACIDSGKYSAKVQNNVREGSTLFGITGTPGNVLINNKTGAWDKLPGAYPYQNFKQKIDTLLQ